MNDPQTAQALDSAKAMPNELGIQGLQPARPHAGNWASLVLGLGMVALMFVGLAMVVWSRFGPQDKPSPKPIAVASDQLAQVKFEPPREPAPNGSAPAVDAAAQPQAAVSPAAQPIALRNPGQGPAATPLVPSLAGSAVPAAAGSTPYPTAPGGYAPPQRRDDSPFVTASGNGWQQGWPQGSSAALPGSNLQRAAHVQQYAVPQNSGSPLATASANLEQYQTQLDGMVRQLQSLTDQVQGPAAGVPGQGVPGSVFAQAPAPVAPAATAASNRNPALFGQLERTNTPRAHATMLGARSYVVPKGVLFQCALKTRVVSAVSGFVGCQVQRPVYSDDGKVVLIERGSHLDGEYRIVQVRPGVTRIPILWTRVRTPHGVTVDLDSPATGPLGDSGITGEVNNRWVERIGAALLLSLIDDAIKLQISENTSNGSSTVVLPNTAATASRLAEKVLDSTINIPPLITAHQGSVVGVYVSRDLDFSGVYRLEAR